MPNISDNEFFRPWSSRGSGESATKKNTSDGNRSGLHLTGLAERGINGGHLSSASCDKENGTNMKRHANTNCVLSVSNNDKNLAITGTIKNLTRMQSGECTSADGALRSSSMLPPEDCSRTLPEKATGCAASVKASSLDLLVGNVESDSTSWPADYLHQTGLYHTLSYPSLSVSSVIWPMEIVPVLPPPVIQQFRQPFYHAHPGDATSDAKYPLSIEHAVGMIQSQEEAAKQLKKLRPKRFRCEHCDVAFSNNGQLKGHIRIHTGERPFKCDVEGCEKAFTRNEELTRHKRIHSGLRPHACPICGKCFGRKDHLKKHTRTHENRDLFATSAAALYALGHAAPPFPPYVFHI
ncbi:uncharacterized protein LOC143216180 [Lasioglossum baleicum]|uniref:uncharacterized protein LOC143216180 n=1 Tax=Lasioglossum baleicum TaxID=434251 RepID=UPI003FCD56A2